MYLSQILVILVLIFSLIFITCWYFTIKKLKTKQAQKLAIIYNEIERERNIKKNTVISQQITDIETKTAFKLAKIKVGIINLSFSYSALFKSLL